MNYQQHDFEKNIKSALKAGDNDAVYAMLVGEIGNLLLNNKLALIRAVRKSGKKISDDISDKELSEIISAGIINKYDIFIKNLLEAIYLEKAKYSNVIGEIASAAGQAIGGIANAIGVSVQSKQQTKQAKEGTKQAKEGTKQAEVGLKGQRVDLAKDIFASKNALQAAKLQAETEKFKSQSGVKTAVTISLAFGGVAIIGIVAFIIYKRNQSAQAPNA